MSHITTIKTKTDLKNKSILESALNELQTQFDGLKINYDQEKDQFNIRYKKIEVYQKSGNLRFVRSDSGYEMQGDPWDCYKEFKRVTGQVFVNYQKHAVQNFLSSKRFSTNVSTSKDGIVIAARRY